MKDEIEYYERQRSKHPLVLILTLGVNIPFVIGVIQQIGHGKPWGSNPVSDTGLLITAIFVFLITISFVFIKLETIINKEGIFVRFSPFQLRYKSFLWENIQEVYIKQYKPLLEYGGWGFRGGKNNRAYNISGKIGLQIIFKNDKKVLIGTTNPEELSETLKKLGK